MLELIRTLSLDEIERIRHATEDILENVGCRVAHPDVLRRVRNAGAPVDEASGIVRFPTPLLRELLAQVPSSYMICGLDGKEYEIGGSHQYCHAIVTDPWIIDYATQQPRRPRLEDVGRHTRIAQQLDPVVCMGLMDFPVADFEGPASSLHAREAHLLSHAKHLCAYTTSIEDFRLWADIKDLLEEHNAGGNGHLMSAAVAVKSPLELAEVNAEHLLLACQYNMPVIPTVCPSAGTTSPYSLAGTLLQANTEAVALAALTQIIKPGHPFQYALGPAAADLMTGYDRYYSIDKVLWKIASVQMGKSYNLPTTAECGGSLNYRYDQQNGAEGILFMLAACASNANLLAGFGSCYNAIGMSAEMMVIHSAWLAVARFLKCGITIDEEHLGLKSIKNSGPGRSFLDDELTLKLMREGEFFGNDLFDMACEFGEGQPILVRAHNRVEEMLAKYKCPVPENIQEDIRRYFANLYRKLER
jgi:trimethylamine--corrinoid protein Co-methyltransferase